MPSPSLSHSLCLCKPKSKSESETKSNPKLTPYNTPKFADLRTRRGSMDRTCPGLETLDTMTSLALDALTNLELSNKMQNGAAWARQKFNSTSRLGLKDLATITATSATAGLGRQLTPNVNVKKSPATKEYFSGHDDPESGSEAGDEVDDDGWVVVERRGVGT